MTIPGTFYLQISEEAFNEIARRLQAVLRDDAIIFEKDGTITLDMTGMALVRHKGVE